MSAPAGLSSLDGLALSNVLRAGIYRLFERSEHLNKINVFPVPDGDTGTNMAMTLGAVLARLDNEPSTHAGELLVRVADAALDGARGNSGAILAQFLLGLADCGSKLPTLGIADLIAVVAEGSRYARDAVTEPREGTLLSVLSSFASELQRLTTGASPTTFRDLLVAALPAVQRSLDATRDQLEVLRSANVVDAGAQGFVDLLSGVTNYLNDGILHAVERPVHVAEEQSAYATTVSDQRYCTECVVTGEAINHRQLRENLSRLGSSLVVGGTHRKVRVHLHTNVPQEAFATAARYGAVTGQKADDMLRQQTATHHARARQVAVVTDSAADIPEAALEALELHVVPARVHFGNDSYLDKVSLSPEAFYQRLANTSIAPKTSQPPPGDFRRLYEFLVSHYDAVVSVSLTARVSGTYNAARTAADRIAGNRVTVIDSLNVSLGQGLIAMYAAECARAGMSASEVIAETKLAIRRTQTFALLARVDYAVRGGRVPRFAQFLADWLRLVPILASTSDGRVTIGGMLWGRHNLTRRFAARMRRRLRGTGPFRVLVGHGNAEPEARKLLDRLVSGRSDIESSHLTSLGAALGVHGGPGMLVVGVQRYHAPGVATAASAAPSPATPQNPHPGARHA